jgi:D-sedoheptulose 7-phosphate isomerase
MSAQQKIDAALKDHMFLLEAAFVSQQEQIADFSARILETFHQGGRLLLLGSGPLGAIASLVANLFLHRLTLERPQLSAIALCHDPFLATALARDGQSDLFFSRQLRALAAPGDVVLAFGDAHRNQALDEAFSAARDIGCVTAALVQGKGEMTGDLPDFLFHLETESAARATEGALFFGHLLCEIVEAELFGI